MERPCTVIVTHNICRRWCEGGGQHSRTSFDEFPFSPAMEANERTSCVVEARSAMFRSIYSGNKLLGLMPYASIRPASHASTRKCARLAENDYASLAGNVAFHQILHASQPFLRDSMKRKIDSVALVPAAEGSRLSRSEHTL